MPGRVRKNEAALRSGEIPVGDINGDALLPLGPQTIGKERKVHFLVSITTRGFGHGVELVFEDRFRVVEQTTDQCRFAIVD